jgi:uncharacterized radical SAM protein YgiQ
VHGDIDVADIMPNFLPVQKSDLLARGWDSLDIIIVSGDAYIDHPSFGAPLIARFLEAQGFKVGIIPQPDWNNADDFLKMGQPNLFWGVSAGNIDSMVNHYTAQRKPRSTDAYSPAADSGRRPDRATIVYTNAIKQISKNVPIVIGGIEASLRRIPHYDYWQNKVRNTILFDSKADILVYGMAERAIAKIASRLKENSGSKLANYHEIMKDIEGTVVISNNSPHEDVVELPEYHKKFSKADFKKMSDLFYKDQSQNTLCQKFNDRYLIHHPPAEPLTTKELDNLYDLNFTKLPHPMYKDKLIPAYEQIKMSITSHRGCFGGCSFCSIGMHQTKKIRSRSIDSIIDEIKKLTKHKEFKGTVTDIGGPSANMYQMYCKLRKEVECTRRSCLFPDICRYLNTDQTKLKKMMSKVSAIESVKHVFVSSGIRFDLALLDEEYIHLLAKYHTSGILKVAPEHYDKEVLHLMNKPSFEVFEHFVNRYYQYCRKSSKKQYVLPYIIVGHPGCGIRETVELAVYLKNNDIKVEQIQEFTPTPMTVSTLMYYVHEDMSGNKIHVPNGREVRLQKALIQWFKPKNKKLVLEALRKIRRMDLVSFFYPGKKRFD